MSSGSHAKGQTEREVYNFGVIPKKQNWKKISNGGSCLQRTIEWNQNQEGLKPDKARPFCHSKETYNIC